MIELNGFDYQYLPGIILPVNDSLLLDISTFLLQGVIPLIVAFITSIVAYSIAVKKIKNEQIEQHKLFKHEFDKIRFSVLSDNYKTLYNSKLACAELLQEYAYSKVLSEKEVKDDYGNSCNDEEIEKSTNEFCDKYLYFYIKYSIVFSDDIYKKMTELKDFLFEKVNEIYNKNGKEGRGFLDAGIQEDVQRRLIELVDLVRKDLLVDINIIRKFDRKDWDID